MEFMLETICDIKNNKSRAKEDPAHHTRIKKWLQKVPIFYGFFVLEVPFCEDITCYCSITAYFQKKMDSLIEQKKIV